MTIARVLDESQLTLEFLPEAAAPSNVFRLNAPYELSAGTVIRPSLADQVRSQQLL